MTPEELEAMTGLKVNYDIEYIRQRLNRFAIGACMLYSPRDVAVALRLLADEYEEAGTEE